MQRIHRPTTSGSNLTFESRLGFPSDLPNMVVGLQTAISRFVAEANDDQKVIDRLNAVKEMLPEKPKDEAAN